MCGGGGGGRVEGVVVVVSVVGLVGKKVLGPQTTEVAEFPRGRHL